MCTDGVREDTAGRVFSEQRVQALRGDRLRSYPNLGSCCHVALAKSLDPALPVFCSDVDNKWFVHRACS